MNETINNVEEITKTVVEPEIISDIAKNNKIVPAIGLGLGIGIGFIAGFVVKPACRKVREIIKKHRKEPVIYIDATNERGDFDEE